MGFFAKGVENDPTAGSRLGGASGGSITDQNALEDDMRKRYANLGQATAVPDLAPWLSGERDQTGNWVAGSRNSQLDAYKIANAMGLGGQTPQQEQLAQSYVAQNQGMQGAARGAGGGARGAAAALGNAYSAIGGNAMSQNMGMQAQQQADMMQGQQLSAAAADALRQGDQGALVNRNYDARQTAQFQQGWSQNDMDRALWVAGEGQKATYAKLGLASTALDQNIQNNINQRNMNNQALGTALQGLGSLANAGIDYADKTKKNPSPQPVNNTPGGYGPKQAGDW